MARTLDLKVLYAGLLFSVLLFSILAIIDFIVYPDWKSYRLIYSGSSSNDLGYDYFFKALFYIANSLHIPYTIFRIALLILLVFLFAYSIRNLTWKDQVGLSIINFVFLSCQIRQGMFVALLYLAVAGFTRLRRSSLYLFASFSHAKTSALFIFYHIYKKTPLLIKALGLSTVFYVLLNFLDYIEYVSLLEDYTFHFEISDKQFTYVSLVTPLLYIALFRKAPFADMALCLIPLVLVVCSLYGMDILGGKILVNSILRVLPVFLSVLVLSGKFRFSNSELTLASLIIFKDIYSSQL